MTLSYLEFTELLGCINYWFSSNLGSLGLLFLQRFVLLLSLYALSRTPIVCVVGVLQVSEVYGFLPVFPLFLRLFNLS